MIIKSKEWEGDVQGIENVLEFLKGGCSNGSTA